MTERQDEFIIRLSKIEGQVRGVKKLIVKEADLESILIQISAVKSALGSVGMVLLEKHMEGLVEEAGGERTRKLLKIIEKTLR